MKKLLLIVSILVSLSGYSIEAHESMPDPANCPLSLLAQKDGSLVKGSQDSDLTIEKTGITWQ